MFVFAHGAGSGQHSEFMQSIAERLALQNISVLRFNFPYMQRIAETGKRRPPDKADTLLAHFSQVLDQVDTTLPIFIGGKSMGGRMASMILDNSSAKGCICMGYPFHPPNKPDKLRTEHLASLSKPTLILQGERDTFGSRLEIQQYLLADSIEVQFLVDGDHSLKPRKSSGVTFEQNLELAMQSCARFIQKHV